MQARQLELAGFGVDQRYCPHQPLGRELHHAGEGTLPDLRQESRRRLEGLGGRQDRRHLLLSQILERMLWQRDLQLRDQHPDPMLSRIESQRPGCGPELLEQGWRYGDRWGGPVGLDFHGGDGNPNPKQALPQVRWHPQVHEPHRQQMEGCRCGQGCCDAASGLG